MLDPSRIAAQIVTCIGFIGGGVIFVRRDAVRGLTTAAIVWLTAAVGMACGAGLFVLALAATAGHFLVVFGFPPIAFTLRITLIHGRLSGGRRNNEKCDMTERWLMAQNRGVSQGHAVECEGGAKIISVEVHELERQEG